MRAIQVQAYYQDFFRYGRVLPFPSGLRMVAGRATATRPQRGIVRWTCKDDQGAGSATIPSCGTKPVTLRVSFPDCWDGRRLDSPDHRSHMAYNSAGGKEMGPQRCPASHPVVVPALQLNVVYPIHGGDGVKLASGSIFGAHADFFNAWKPSVLQRRVDDVLNGGQACDDFLGCTTISPVNTEPVTARPRPPFVDRFDAPVRRRHAPLIRDACIRGPVRPAIRSGSGRAVAAGATPRGRWAGRRAARWGGEPIPEAVLSSDDGERSAAGGTAWKGCRHGGGEAQPAVGAGRAGHATLSLERPVVSRVVRCGNGRPAPVCRSRPGE